MWSSKASTSKRGSLRRMAGEESGQALLMAVSLLVILAMVAALFIAMVAARSAQTARQADLVALQQIAEAGLRFADDALTNGPDGADWRPQEGPYDFGRGRFTLTVSYNPSTTEDTPYWNCIRVESVADLGLREDGTARNPFLKRRVVAYKRVMINDYLRFVSNRDHSNRPAQLGVPLLVNGTAYRSVFSGAIRVNSDLDWYGNNLVNLDSTGAGAGRVDDTVEVAGTIRHDDTDGDGDASDDTSVHVTFQGGAEQTALPSEDPNFTTLPAGTPTASPRYVDGMQTTDGAGYQRWARYLTPPAISRQRYLALTRDSGRWMTTPDGLSRYNTGWYGYGQGIYIANGVHLQSHDYEVMRANWLGSDARWWDSPRLQVYTPPAVRIVLHGGDGQDAAVEMEWPNPAPGEGWRDEQGQPLGSDTLTLPYPANGVIYAEGNVSVRGALPDGQSVTIVSEGTIYIEGSILDSAGGKVALLARDSVVLNTTVCAGFLYPTETHLVEPSAYSGDLPAPYEVKPGEPFEASLFCLNDPPDSGPGAAQLFVLHSGAANETLPPGEAGQTVMELLVNGNIFDWDSADTQYFLFGAPPTAAQKYESNAISPLYEGLPDYGHDGVQGNADDRTMEIATHANWNSIKFQTPTETVRNYWLYKLAVQPTPGYNSAEPQVGDVEVDALIYAEGGSWFVIPGQFFTPPGVTLDGYPSPGEPLDVKITIRGAITENRTADVADVALWTQHWRGSDENWNTTRDRGLTYVFDPGLRQTTGGRLILPKLPVSPEVIAWREYF